MRTKENPAFYGRKSELIQLKRCFESPKAELIVVYGRRRVGKSALIRKAAQGRRCLEFDGIKGEATAQQIKHFLHRLSQQIQSPPYDLHSWEAVFQALSSMVAKGEWVLVFDELPWMACGKTRLIHLIKSYWDNHWSKNPKLTLFLCGSIATFMVNQVAKSKALYGRPTLLLHLKPLPPQEALEFFGGKRTLWDAAQLLMVTGGIPKYLEWINPKQSFALNLQHLFFEADAPLFTEYEVLFQEQFGTDSVYAQIVRALAQRKLTLDELSDGLGWQRTGGLKRYLNYLQNSDFIELDESLDLSTYHKHGPAHTKYKGKKYVLSDPYLRFYFTFVEPHRRLIKQGLSKQGYTQLVKSRWETYAGLAFERLCRAALGSILTLLSIPETSVLDCGAYFWQPQRAANKNQSAGFQLDMVIVRSDHVYTVIECKFSLHSVGLEVVKAMQNKLVKLSVPKTVSVEKILIAAMGATVPVIKSGYFNQVLTLEAILA